MPRRRCRPQSSYLAGLIQEVHKKLEKASDTPSQCGEILRELFTDVALEVDDRAQDLLYNQDFELDSPSITEHENKRSLCYYELIADYYAQVLEAGKTILPLFVRIWSSPFASHIFALLFYQFLFDTQEEQTHGFLRYSTAFIEGATNVFWIDLQSNTRRFFSLYHYVFEEVALNSQRLSKLPQQSQRHLVSLLSRFFFFYEPADKLGELLLYMPAFSSFGVGAPADAFVLELADQLQKIKVEPVLLHYLESSKSLKGLKLLETTSTRLKSALYSMTGPGGPMYPTRPVRHAAWDTLNSLFPVGQYSRYVISLFFRLLHPYYWPTSILNVVMHLFFSILNALRAILNAIWRFVFRRDYFHHRQN